MSARRDPWLDADVDRFGIFVPAIMSAGLLFSVVTLLRDAFHTRRHRHRDRRVGIAAAVTARHVASGRGESEALAQALRPRLAYLLTSLTCLFVAVYVVVGAIGNYGRPNGYVSNLAWLLALSLVSGILLLWLALGAGLLFARFPRTPAWVTELLLSTPLGQPPAPAEARTLRRFVLGWAAVLSSGVFGIVTLAVASSRGAFAAADEQLLEAVAGWTWLGHFELPNVLGRSEVAVGVAVVIGVATLRCVPFAAAYLGSVLASLAVSSAVRMIVERERPPGTTLTGWTDSYPSGHVAQVVLLAGLVPLAARVLTNRQLVAWPVGLVAATVAVFATLLRVHHSLHWPTDVIGGIALGTTMVLIVRWALENPAWHRRCHHCPWAPTPGPPRAVVHLEEWVHGPLRALSLTWALLAIAFFTVLTFTEGIPRDPDGASVGEIVEVTGTYIALGLLAVGWLLGLRWSGIGAVGLALGGLVLGALSSVAYHPAISLLVAGAFGVPAVGLWVGWQRHRTRRAVVVLAAVTAALTLGLYGTAATVNDRFFGPAHPQSDTPALPIDQVRSLWAGAATTDGFEVGTRLADDDHDVALVVLGDDDEVVARSPTVATPDGRFVRLRVAGLQPATTYRYAIEVDGVLDDHRGRGRATTAPDGPADLRIAVASCARTGSNGQVFDAIRRLGPDLYISAGDFHYGNPSSPHLARFRTLVESQLQAPAQAALYREVPIAYVWDDHDYGPNDADSTSPTRETAWMAYREMVPSFAAPTGPVNQAFTLGRVRIVLTDSRSAKTAESMLGADQLDWLLDELRDASATHALVLWVNPIPWISEVDPTRDDWGAYPDERQRILEVIEQAEIENLVMLSGDAHMVALDDGTNSGGFPVLHAAALDRPGNVKGGPYSDGAFPGPGQFGLVEVDDDGGDRIEVTLSGRTWEDEVLVSRTFAFAVPAGARR